MADIDGSRSPSGGNGHKTNGRDPRPVGFITILERLFGREQSDLPERIADAIDEDEENSLQPAARRMLLNVLELGEMRVDDIMVPRADIVAIEESASLDEVLAQFRAGAHSRLPVFRRTLDHPTGLIHIKDVLNTISAGGSLSTENFSINRIRREVLFVPESMPVFDLLLKMQATRMHMALVVDEYGGTDGLVTLEDLVEQVVGEISDEHDVDEGPSVVQRDDGGYDADARTLIEDFEPLIGVDLLPEDEEEDIETLGGLVFSLAGQVPVCGEIIPHPGGLEFHVIDADPRRIKKVRVYRVADTGLNGAETAPEPAAPQS